MTKVILDNKTTPIIVNKLIAKLKKHRIPDKDLAKYICNKLHGK